MKYTATRSKAPLSHILLRAEMSLTILQALAALVSYLHMRLYDPARALILYPRILPYLVFPLIITLFTFLLVERLTKEG